MSGFNNSIGVGYDSERRRRKPALKNEPPSIDFSQNLIIKIASSRMNHVRRPSA